MHTLSTMDGLSFPPCFHAVLCILRTSVRELVDDLDDFVEEIMRKLDAIWYDMKGS